MANSKILSHINMFVIKCRYTSPGKLVYDASLVSLNMQTCTIVACLPPIKGFEKCRVIRHNPHFSSLCSLSCRIWQECSAEHFSACDWWKVVNCGTSYIYLSEPVVYVIPFGLLGSTS